MIVYTSKRLNTPLMFTSVQACLDWLDSTIERMKGVGIGDCPDGTVWLGNTCIGCMYDLEPIA